MTAIPQRSRPAPAFQEYASDMLANSRYRTMCLSERGLMDTMRRECWVNGAIPRKPHELAAYLGLSVDEVNSNLSNKVLSFFCERNDELICPELDAYRAGLENRTKKLSEGGRNGGRVTQQKNKEARARLEPRVEPLSGEELSGDELSGSEKRFLGRDISVEEINEFVAEYDATPEITNDYYRASKGGH